MGRVTYSKHKLTKLKNTLTEVDGASVESGYISDVRYQSGERVMDIALLQMEGNRDIPSRPFMYAFFNDPQDREYFQGWFKQVFYDAMKGRKSLSYVSKNIGNYCTSSIEAEIRAWTDPPNSPKTIEKKGKNDPLVDSELMANSLEWRLVK